MPFIPNASVAIILVNWNGYSFTTACLDSLEKVNFPDFRVILVDNASKNEEAKRLKQNYPEIDLLENDSNLGFAAGNNVGIRKALEVGCTHVLLLNNDTIVQPDFLEEMLLISRSEPSIAVVQPLIYFMYDRDLIWNAGGKWNKVLGRAITKGDRKLKSEFPVTDHSIDWATGCCMLISRKALLEVGLLNEQYFAYFEDVEWSLRFREKGYDITLATKAIIYHEAGASSKEKHSEGTLSPKVFYYHVRNQFYLLRTHVSGLSKPFAFGYHILRFTVWMLYFALRGRSQKLKSVVRGMREGIFDQLEKASIWH